MSDTPPSYDIYLYSNNPIIAAEDEEMDTGGPVCVNISTKV